MAATTRPLVSRDAMLIVQRESRQQHLDLAAGAASD
jgi:hypothetical protein